MLGESKLGTHSQPTEPSGAMSAPVWQFDRNAYSAIGGKGDGAAALWTAVSRPRDVGAVAMAGSVARERAPGLELPVGVGLAADVDLHLGDLPAGEGEGRLVLLADGVGAVAADAQAFAAQR